MIFPQKKGPSAQLAEPASSLYRVVQMLLEACALHSVEFDAEEHSAFRYSIRDIAERFDRANDYQDYLILTGETNKTIQSYNHLVEKFIRDLSKEKQLGLNLLAESLLQVCHASEQSSRRLREVEHELGKASALPDMRELRSKLAECIATVTREAEAQEVQSLELRKLASESATMIEPRDPVTGLPTLKSAEIRLKEVCGNGQTGFVVAFFLKNVDVVNRRFGFSVGDDLLRRFAVYLSRSLQPDDQLFRWRGPCFVIISARAATIEAVQGEATRVASNGPEEEVESEGRSMLLRLTAATSVFQAVRGGGIAELSGKIDQFAAEQFRMSPVKR